jgi:hypothetical protein
MWLNKIKNWLNQKNKGLNFIITFFRIKKIIIIESIN